MVLYYQRSIYVLDHRVLIPTTEKVIKPQPYQIYHQKTGSCYWSVNYTRTKIPFPCSGNEWVANFQIYTNWAYALHWRRQNKFCLSKNGIAWQYCISLGKWNYNDIFAATLIPVRKAVDKNIVVTTLVFGRSNDAGNTTLWQRYLTWQPKFNQNPTLIQRRVPAGLLLCIEINASFFFLLMLFSYILAEFNTVGEMEKQKQPSERK